MASERPIILRPGEGPARILAFFEEQQELLRAGADAAAFRALAEAFGWD